MPTTVHVSPPITFYIREEPYGFLSNFWRATQTIDGVTYGTNEAYYQAMRAKDPAVQEWIGQAPHPYLAMKVGRTLTEKGLERPDWTSIKLDVMLRGLRAKFRQNAALANDLLDTGYVALHEAPKNGWKDSFWGNSPQDDGTPGASHLGRLLMVVREELRASKHGVPEFHCESCKRMISHAEILRPNRFNFNCPHCASGGLVREVRRTPPVPLTPL
jgi:N-glycosidase YbiA